MKIVSKTVRTLLIFAILLFIPVISMRIPIQASENYSYDPNTQLLEIKTAAGFEEFKKDHANIQNYYHVTYDITVNSIKVYEGITSIAPSAFEHCTNVTSVSLPSSVTSIEEYAFVNCNRLETITLPPNLISIGKSAFHHCTQLKSINLPDSVTYIGNSAFSDTDSMASMTLPSHLTAIGDFALSSTGLTSITIPESVTSLGYGAFFANTSLTSVTILGNVTSIGQDAFRTCLKLSSINIPDTVTSIEAGAFYGNMSLTSITLPSNVKSIGKEAFYYCKNLSSININAKEVPTLGQWALNELPADFKIYVPSSENNSILKAYRNADGWKEYRDHFYTEPHSHIAGDWIIDTPATATSPGTKHKECTVCGEIMETAAVPTTGDLAPDALTFKSGLYSFTVNSPENAKTKTVVLNGFVKGKSTSNVTINKTVTYKGTTYKITAIGDKAFYKNTKIKQLNLSNNIISIGEKAFYKCTRLQKATIGTGLKNIGDYAFYQDKKLTSLTIKSKKLANVGKQSLSQCRNLKIRVPSSKVKTYSKLFKNKGQSKTVKVTK